DACLARSAPGRRGGDAAAGRGRARRGDHRRRRDAARPRRPRRAGGGRRRSRGVNALVVEDSPTMRQLIVFALRRIRGLNGVDAVQKLAGRAFDIVLTDINMPVMDGLKLVGKIRAEEATKKLPIVIITTEGSAEDRQRALALGADAYITKPIQGPQIIATV